MAADRSIKIRLISRFDTLSKRITVYHAVYSLSWHRPKRNFKEFTGMDWNWNLFCIQGRCFPNKSLLVSFKTNGNGETHSCCIVYVYYTYIQQSIPLAHVFMYVSVSRYYKVKLPVRNRGGSLVSVSYRVVERFVKTTVRTYTFLPRDGRIVPRAYHQASLGSSYLKPTHQAITIGSKYKLEPILIQQVYVPSRYLGTYSE